MSELTKQARGMSPERPVPSAVLDAIRARARELADAAPLPTEQQLAQLRRWFDTGAASRRRAGCRRDGRARPDADVA